MNSVIVVLLIFKCILFVETLLLIIWLMDQYFLLLTRQQCCLTYISLATCPKVNSIFYLLLIINNIYVMTSLKCKLMGLSFPFKMVKPSSRSISAPLLIYWILAPQVLNMGLKFVKSYITYLEEILFLEFLSSRASSMSIPTYHLILSRVESNGIRNNMA